MATPKQDMKRLKIITTCHDHIRASRWKRKVLIVMPGAPERIKRRRFSANGPRGQVVAQTNDKRKIFVAFRADELLTSLEEIRNGNTTG